MTDEAKVLELIEIARDTGKIRKGANEATKAIEKGDAKLVAYAGDVSPKEIVMHLPLLCKEKNIFCLEIKSKEELGAAAGLGVSTSAVAIVREGDAKSGIEALTRKKEEVKEKKEAPPPEEAPKKEKKEEPKLSSEGEKGLGKSETSQREEKKEEKKKEVKKKASKAEVKEEKKLEPKEEKPKEEKKEASTEEKK